MITLTSNTTFYVSPVGSDLNDGLTALTPWETLDKAWSTLLSGYDFNGYIVTVQLANGVYRKNLNAFGVMRGQLGAGRLVFRGDPVNPSNVIVSPYSGNPFAAAYGAMYTVNGVAMDSQGIPGTPNNPNGGADLIAVGQLSAVRISNIHFYYGMGNGHIAVAFGGNLTVDQPGYTIKGGGQYHLTAGAGGTIYYNTDGIPGLMSVTLQGTPSFTAAFACANGCAVINAQAISFSGAANCKTYLAKNNGIIDTRNGNPNYFPGNISGHCESGGQYN